MPQGRRKTPFSGKKKRQQLQDKRERKNEDFDHEERKSKSEYKLVTDESLASTSTSSENGPKLFTNTIDPQRFSSKSSNTDRYRLQFVKQSKEELDRMKKDAYRLLAPAHEDDTEIEIDSVFLPGSSLDIPKRPSWDFSFSKEQLEAREHRYFTEYLMNIEKNFNLDDLSYFETNLETWRQLWRVLEMSDILLIIVDVRFPSLLFSPAIYNHVTKELNREVILVLNKIDLVPPSVVVAWQHYFKKHYPQLYIISFTSFPGTDTDVVAQDQKVQRSRRRKNWRMAAQATMRLLKICQNIVKTNEEEMHETDTEAAEVPIKAKESDEQEAQYERYRNGTLTIGCLGFPNVGKSSLINGIMGKKVVSVSRTPGHTKHFQTIFITPTVRLCDCPGLVFPSKVPKPLQVLNGSFPIAQVREPYSAIRFLAERIPMNCLLHIEHPNKEKNWTPYDICDGWAIKRGFFTSKGARRDVHRAGNNLLRMALEGRIRFCLKPPGYLHDKSEKYNFIYADVVEIKQILESGQEMCEENEDELFTTVSSETESE
uniref:Guanine nucleotide-binding protein-like 1 n=1 Tax=Strigamia maritima TaxID=126957 RepID=T1IJQ9_STRMM